MVLHRVAQPRGGFRPRLQVTGMVFEPTAWHPVDLVTVTPRVSVPTLPALNVMEWLPWPEVMVPFVIVHA